MGSSSALDFEQFRISRRAPPNLGHQGKFPRFRKIPTSNKISRPISRNHSSPSGIDGSAQSGPEATYQPATNAPALQPKNLSIRTTQNPPSQVRTPGTISPNAPNLTETRSATRQAHQPSPSQIHSLTLHEAKPSYKPPHPGSKFSMTRTTAVQAC